jgi:hypothetical protein
MIAATVPLTLLTSGTASEASVALRSLLDGSGEFALAHASPPNATAFDIVYQGVSLQLAVNAQIPGFTDYKQIFCNLDSASMPSGVGLGFGEHLAGGERVPAILQALLGAAAKLGLSLGAVATLWHPAQIVSGFGYFSKSVADYLEGGAFPVWATVDFTSDANGDIKSTGLAFLAGREIQIASKSGDENERMRRFVEAVHDLATNEPIQSAA